MEILHIVAGLFGEQKKKGGRRFYLWDEKRIFGFAYLLSALLLPFTFPAIDTQFLVTFASLGVALYFGVPLGDAVPFIGTLHSSGLGDLLTNKANHGDGLRAVGVAFQIASLVYVISPLWLVDSSITYENFACLGGVGVIMSWGAVWGDHVAVHKKEE